MKPTPRNSSRNSAFRRGIILFCETFHWTTYFDKPKGVKLGILSHADYRVVRWGFLSRNHSLNINRGLEEKKSLCVNHLAKRHLWKDNVHIFHFTPRDLISTQLLGQIGLSKIMAHLGQWQQISYPSMSFSLAYHLTKLINMCQWFPLSITNLPSSCSHKRSITRE